MDYSHLIKKIRNNLHKSGRLDSYKRHLKCNGHFIYWEYFVNAYMWDIAHNPFPMYQKLRPLPTDPIMKLYFSNDHYHSNLPHDIS
jgi:hypothetical protein